MEFAAALLSRGFDELGSAAERRDRAVQNENEFSSKGTNTALVSSKNSEKFGRAAAPAGATALPPAVLHGSVPLQDCSI
jgi:hypothetical protein